MKRVATMFAVAAAAALLSTPASAAPEPICVYLDTPYPVACVYPFETE